MQIVNKKLEEIIPYENNPRKNDATVDGLAECISEFGITQPIVVDAKGVIVAGHTRYKAAQKLGLKEFPCLVADSLSDEQIRAYRILDNRIAERSQWDKDLLELELASLDDFPFGKFDVDFEEFDIKAPTVQKRDVKDLSASDEKKWEIIIECHNEAHQKHSYEQLTAEGLSCRVLAL